MQSSTMCSSTVGILLHSTSLLHLFQFSILGSMLCKSFNITKIYLTCQKYFFDFRYCVQKKNQVQCSVHSHTAELDWKFIASYLLDYNCLGKSNPGPRVSQGSLRTECKKETKYHSWRIKYSKSNKGMVWIEVVLATAPTSQNSSGLGLESELNCCNWLYHMKIWTIAIGPVLARKTRQSNITTFTPIRYLSSNRMVT